MKRKLTILLSSLLILSLLTILSLSICHKLSDYFITYQLEKDLKNSNYVYTLYNTDTNNTNTTQQDLTLSQSHIQLNNPKTSTIIKNNESDTIKIKKYLKLGIDNKNKINNTLKDNTIKNSNSESIIISNTLLEIARLSAEYSNLLRIYNLEDAKRYYYENKDKLRVSMIFVEGVDEDKDKDKKDEDKIGNAVIVIGENIIQPLSRKVVSLDDENGEEDSGNENGSEDKDKPKVKLVTYEYDFNLIRDNKVFKFIIVENGKKSIFDVNLGRLNFNEY